MMNLNTRQETYIKLWGIACVLKFMRLVLLLSKIKQIGLTLQVFYNV